MIHLINRKYMQDTTDSMLFTPIVEDIIAKAGRVNVTVWARSSKADINLESHLYLLKLFLKGFGRIKRTDTVFVTSTPPFLSFVILFMRFFKRFKVIVQVQDLYPDIMKFLSWKYKFTYYIFYPFAYILYKQADSFLTISDCIAKQLIENYNIQPGRISVAENWTDIDDIEFKEVQPTNKIIYIGNIGRAHDYSYFVDFVLAGNIPSLDIVIKTDNSSKINVFNSAKLSADGLKAQSLPSFIEWNHDRYSKEELAAYLLQFDYSFLFIGQDFDRILFPCKIYSSLSQLLPVIFFGPEESYINQWLEENELGFHYSRIAENYRKLNLYRHNIHKYNLLNTFEKKINKISKIILE